MDLPELKLPTDSERLLAVLAESEAGRELLVPVVDSFKDFFVTDARKEQHLTTVQSQLNESRGSSNRSVLHDVVKSKDSPLFEGLLKLGLDPDLRDSMGNTPAHSAFDQRFADGLILCRADPLITNFHQFTPGTMVASGLAYLTGHPSIVNTVKAIQAAWEKVIKDGPPSVAQLAAEKKLFALQNVCRRRVFADSEKTATYQGKDAIQWAEHHGHTKLVAELRYFLAVPSSLPGVRASTSSATVQASTSGVQRSVIRPFVRASHLQHQHHGVRTGSTTPTAPMQPMVFDSALKQEVEMLKGKLASAEKGEDELRKDIKKMQDDWMKTQEQWKQGLEDLKKGQDELKKGQEEWKKGQEEWKKGQEEWKKGQVELKKGQVEWKNENELVQERVNLLAEHLSNLTFAATSSETANNKKRRLD